MERTLSQEERIRRAEEIYQRRRRADTRVSTSTYNSKNKKDYLLFKKLILQILICLFIYFIFYLVKNSNYIFSNEVIEKANRVLSYDINFNNLYSNIEDFYNNNLKQYIYINKEENVDKNESENEDKEKEKSELENEEAGIGGGEDELLNNEILQEENIDTNNKENEQPLSQMEIDANDIKSNYSLIVPLKGTITSRFGARTPTDIVSANHAGIDIGANAGTVFISSMDGIVKEVSSEGGYGNHVLIEKDDVITLYAHCKKIYVKQGDIITQGQNIGEVGSTGNATGPHLHFEIRKSGRVVNPEYILEF